MQRWKNKLRFPSTVHPQTAELVQQKEAEDTFDLIMRMNQRIIHMEEELERIAQRKQGESTSHPPPPIPANVPVPPAQLAAILAVIPTSTTAGTTTPETSMSMDEMMKAIKDLEL